MALWENLLTTRFSKYENVVPEEDSFIADFPMVAPADRQGALMVYPIQQSLSNGTTFTTSDDVVDLNDPISPTTLQVQISAPSAFIQENIPNQVIMKSQAGVSEAGHAASYFEPLDFYAENAIEGLQNQLEILYMFGPGAGSATLSDIGVAALTGSGANLGTAGYKVRFTAASWSEGIYNTLTNAKVDIYSSNGSTPVETGVSVVQVSDASVCEVQLFKASSTAVVSVGDKFVLRGTLGNSMIGVGAQLRNNTTMFNINSAATQFWRARQFNCGSAALTSAKFLSACTRLRTMGAKSGLMSYLDTAQFNDIVLERDELLRYVGNAKNIDVGSETIKMITSAGEIELKRTIRQKQGECWLLPKEYCVTAGSSNVSLVKGSNAAPIYQIPNKSGWQVKAQANAAPLIRELSKALLIHSIVSTTQSSPT